MEAKTISGFKISPYRRLRDKIGSLEKSVKLKRMEPYADIIGEVLARHNTDDDQRTMMFKLIRGPVPGTTNRKKHTENVRDIAGEIADNFDWLNSDITRVMAKEHDTGHTFLGHSGEWWISSINDTYGMPNYVHNATGARKLVYREKVYDEIEAEILARDPQISQDKLEKIKGDLWLIMDGINCHNGEKSEYSYAPDFSKNEKRFINEVMGCYVKKGFDRTLVPATAEGSLMRLCDKISYIPFDLVDIFRNKCNIPSGKVDGEEHDFYREYEQRFKAMGMPEGSLQRLLDCKTEEEYDGFAREMQSHLIKDVIANTKRNNIRMSPEMSEAMHGVRDINNRMMVNYTVMKEDHEVYVPAMEKLMTYYADVLLHNYIVDPDKLENSTIANFSTDRKLAAALKESFEYNSLLRGFAEFVSHTTPEDFEFTVESCKKALAETIDSELDVAQSVATGRISRDTIQARGLKAERISTYENAFMRSLDAAYNENLFQEYSRNPINNFKKNVWLKKTKAKIKAEALSGNERLENATGTIPLSKMVAMDIGAQYLASLNDEQFFTLLKQANMITPEQEQSLRRPYNTFDFRAEHQKHAAWDNISKLQKMDEERQRKIAERKSKSLFDRFLGR